MVVQWNPVFSILVKRKPLVKKKKSLFLLFVARFKILWNVTQCWVTFSSGSKKTYLGDKETTVGWMWSSAVWARDLLGVDHSVVWPPLHDPTSMSSNFSFPCQFCHHPEVRLFYPRPGWLQLLLCSLLNIFFFHQRWFFKLLPVCPMALYIDRKMGPGPSLPPISTWCN